MLLSFLVSRGHSFQMDRPSDVKLSRLSDEDLCSKQSKSVHASEAEPSKYVDGGKNKYARQIVYLVGSKLQL